MWYFIIYNRNTIDQNEKRWKHYTLNTLFSSGGNFPIIIKLTELIIYALHMLYLDQCQFFTYILCRILRIYLIFLVDFEMCFIMIYFAIIEILYYSFKKCITLKINKNKNNLLCKVKIWNLPRFLLYCTNFMKISL